MSYYVLYGKQKRPEDVRDTKMGVMTFKSKKSAEDYIDVMLVLKPKLCFIIIKGDTVSFVKNSRGKCKIQ